MAETPRPPVDLSTRLALRKSEAAAALGVSDRTFRTLRPHIPTVTVGETELVPVDALREWLTKHAVVDGDLLDKVAEELMSGLR
jgi:hypothetical protein